MISAFGAILLIAAGGYAGFSALEHLRTSLRSAETILDASRDMRTEILCHRTPLPQLLERLGARYPRLFPDAENACMLVREFSFLSVWTANIRCAALPKPLEEPLLRLGAQLCSGTEPEQALDALDASVRLVRDALREKVTTALREVADRAIARAELPSGTYNLILSGENAAEVLSYYIARSSAGMVYPGYSTWKVGTDVQPEMKDGERLNMTLRAKVPFSSEAIPMKDRPVIADGKVETLHGGARMSYYLGIEPTGDYSAYSCENGSVSFEELKKEPYLYAVTFSDFQMDTMSGHFGGEIRLAYLFDGERVRIVTGGSVNGSINACSGGMKFTTERYDSKNYSGPFAVMLPGVRVAGSLAEQE